jgi:hypothetical protein
MENHISLISNAWRLVADNGHLLVVTHRGEKDDWSKLLDFVGMGKFYEYERVYKQIIGALNTRGQTTLKRVTTTLETNNTYDMIEAMAFVAAAGNKTLFDRFTKAQDSVAKLLKEKYRTSSGSYSFPYTHIFISTAKSKQLHTPKT